MKNKIGAEIPANKDWQKLSMIPSPTDILKACAKLQKTGANLSKMTIVHDQDNMNLFWIINKKDLGKK